LHEVISLNIKPVHYVLGICAALLLAAAGYFVLWPGKAAAPSSTFVLLDGSKQHYLRGRDA
jgi:hypothetical protein